ncbi:MAG: nicotinate-nucleotide adenylyltransferase [Nitrospira sp.]|nr:nicotinate-nucleotide adenylyltransferase [Nitrospira sp.]
MYKIYSIWKWTVEGMKIGIFGGTFNPIHYGHLRAAEEVRERLEFNKIVFIPSGNPPLKNIELADAEHRYKMAELAIDRNPFFEISDIEYKSQGKSYTVNTIEELKEIYHGKTLYFILGIDAFLDMPNWWHPEKLITLIDFVVIPKPHFRFIELLTSPYIHEDKKTLEKLDAFEIESCTLTLRNNRNIIASRLPLIDISATRIRRQVKAGKSIKYLLPEAVESYIISNKLYRG